MIKNLNITLKKCLYTCCIVFLVLAVPVQAQKTVISTADSSFTIENYYRARWGSADEFIQLWRKNHYPLLKKALEHGDILSIKVEKPRMHSSEDSRWDYKVIIIFRNVQDAFDPNLLEPYKKQLFPDTDKLVRDEQHRFELLIAHWDLAVQNINLEE